MSDDLVINLQNVSKAYPLYAKHLDMLKELVFGGVRHDLFWALRDVSFKVKAGQRVGIIGPNGAGKSTLLQIIAGNVQPTTGVVQVNGSISALLSLVPAWNVEQTGIENIRFNLLLRGCTTSQIALLTEDIIDFAELGPFIHQPVKTYSAGMGARLSFAIATTVSPEILIVDEVLGAGDGYFAAKAARRMQEFCDKGKALLFVSHSTAAVQQMCDTVMWIQNGTVRMFGEAEYVLRQYELDFRKAEDEKMRPGNALAASIINKTASPDELVNKDRIRFRIVSENHKRFTATHFVESIQIDGIDGSSGSVSLPLETTNIELPSCNAALDVLSSEWGRLHERSGHLSRILSTLTGRRPGGHFIIKVPDVGRPNFTFKAEIVSSIADGNENLSLQVLDPESGDWKSLERVELTVSGSSENSTFKGEVKIPGDIVLENVRKKVSIESRPDVEITDVSLLVDGTPHVSVRERSDFEIVTQLEFNNTVDVADVCIKITRSDGVHTFWQSSGLVGQNLLRSKGIKRVRFKFDNCFFGAGDYSVTVHVTNGWDYPTNFPYSQVLARSIDALKFRVIQELGIVNFGVVNVRIPVVVE